MNSPRARFVVSWIAAFALFWAALAPSLSVLAAPLGDTIWIEACSSKGPVRIALTTDEALTTASPSADKHCPYCRLQEDKPALMAVFFWLSTLSADMPSWSPAPDTVFSPGITLWRTPQSRAPPQRQA